MTASHTTNDPFDARYTFDTGHGSAQMYRLSALDDDGYNLDRLPISIRIGFFVALMRIRCKSRVELNRCLQVLRAF